MKLTEMKITKKERNDKTESCSPCMDEQTYPYGLTLRLDNGSLEKLGMESLPKVGAKMSISAIGVITSVSSHESKNRDDRNVEIQIQHLGVESEDDGDELDDIVKRKRA